MKKALLLALLFLATSFAANAAKPWLVQYGITAGLAGMTSSMPNEAENKTGYEFKNKMGGQFGITSRLYFKKFRLAPEILYSFYCFDIKGASSGSRNSTKKLTIHTVNVPIMFSKKVWFLALELGPVFNILTSENVDGSSSMDLKLKRPTVGYAAGVGFDIRKVYVGFRYYGDFNKSDQAFTKNTRETQSFRSRTDSWKVGLTYSF